MLKFSFKFLKPYYFLTLSLIWFDENFVQCSHPPPPLLTHTHTHTHTHRSCQNQGHGQNFPETKCAVSGKLSCLATGLVISYSTGRPPWLSWMRRPTGDQEVMGSTPAEVGNILSWRLIMKYFLRSFSPFR